MKEISKDVMDLMIQLGFYTAASFMGTFAMSKQSHFKDLAYRSILNGFVDPAGIVGRDGKVILANKALEGFLGYTEAELMQMSFIEFTIEKYITADSLFYSQLIKREIDHYNIDKGWIKKQGPHAFGRLTVLPIIFEDHVIAAFVKILPKVANMDEDSPMHEEPPSTDDAPGFRLPAAEEMASSKDHDWRTQLLREVTGNKKPFRLITLGFSVGLIYWLFFAGGLNMLIASITG